mgnify:CR=1 FL=1
MKDTNHKRYQFESREISSIAIFTALMVLLNILLIPVPQPLQFFGFAPVLIYFSGILLKPKRAFLICALGSVIGQFLASVILGDFAFLPLYLLGAFVARGLEGLFISLLETNLVRKKELSVKKRYFIEIIILIIGCTWEVYGYWLVGGPYWLILYGTPLEFSLFVWYLPVFIDLISIPIAMPTIIAARKAFQQDYLDNVLFGDQL